MDAELAGDRSLYPTPGAGTGDPDGPAGAGRLTATETAARRLTSPKSREWRTVTLAGQPAAALDGPSEPADCGSCASTTRARWYDLVILTIMKTAISLPDETFRRVNHAAKRLGVSRSEFFARAAEKALDALEDEGTTEAINHAIARLPADHAFTDAAAATLAAGNQH